jgi:hypothetical protein
VFVEDVEQNSSAGGSSAAASEEEFDDDEGMSRGSSAGSGPRAGEEEDEVNEFDAGEVASAHEAEEERTRFPAFEEVRVSLIPGDVGFGMQLVECGRRTRISALHPTGPALAGGLRVDDVLLVVCDSSTEGLTVGEVKALLAQESRLNHEVALVLRRAR